MRSTRSNHRVQRLCGLCLSDPDFRLLHLARYLRQRAFVNRDRSGVLHLLLEFLNVGREILLLLLRAACSLEASADSFFISSGLIVVSALDREDQCLAGER